MFEQLLVRSKVQEEPPSDDKTATPPAQEGGVGERDIEGDKGSSGEKERELQWLSYCSTNNCRLQLMLLMMETQGCILGCLNFNFGLYCV